MTDTLFGRPIVEMSPEEEAAIGATHSSIVFGKAFDITPPWMAPPPRRRPRKPWRRPAQERNRRARIRRHAGVGPSYVAMVRVGDRVAHARVVAINYHTNTITLDRPLEALPSEPLILVARHRGSDAWRRRAT